MAKVQVIVQIFGGLVDDVLVFESKQDAERHWYEFWGTDDDDEIEGKMECAMKEDARWHVAEVIEAKGE